MRTSRVSQRRESVSFAVGRQWPGVAALIVRRMKRAFRLWLTVGYWIISFVLQFALLLLPFAHAGSGILHSGPASNGVHTVQFHGAPGDAVLVFVTQDGERKVTFWAGSPLG